MSRPSLLAGIREVNKVPLATVIQTLDNPPKGPIENLRSLDPLESRTSVGDPDVSASVSSKTV